MWKTTRFATRQIVRKFVNLPHVALHRRNSRKMKKKRGLYVRVFQMFRFSQARAHGNIFCLRFFQQFRNLWGKTFRSFLTIYFARNYCKSQRKRDSEFELEFCLKIVAVRRNCIFFFFLVYFDKWESRVTVIRPDRQVVLIVWFITTWMPFSGKYSRNTTTNERFIPNIFVEKVKRQWLIFNQLIWSYNTVRP